MKKIVLGLLILVAGCSNDDPPTFCEEVQQKNSTCGIAGIVDCQTADAQQQLIKNAIKACLIPQGCDAWTSYVTNTYMNKAAIDCFGIHQIEVTGMFTCADGSGGVPTEAQCDGDNNCPDGSDETGCPSG